MKLPEKYMERMKALLGDEYDEHIASLESPRLFGLRVNTSKISPEDFEKISPFNLRKIPYIPNGYFYDGEKESPAKHPYYFAGLYYLQDPSAMTPASRLPVERGDRVLDLCAAPGGKSTELAAKLAGTGLLVANDISAKRAKALQKNIELFGVANSLITTEYPERLAEYFPHFFDKILIDAPCSGEGMFRKDATMVKSWSEDSPEKYAAMQEDIVRHALPMLADGGYMLYSTCTFSPLEDEGTVEKILAMDESLELVRPEWYEGFAEGRPDAIGSGNESLKKCVRIFPHRMDGEGHFLAVFRKRSGGDEVVGKELAKPDVASVEMGLENSDFDVEKSEVENAAFGGGNVGASGDFDEKRDRELGLNSNKKAMSGRDKNKKKKKEIVEKRKRSKISKEERELWGEFSEEILREFQVENIESHDGKLFYVTDDMPAAAGLKFIRQGLYLGECKKKRFEPSQALAMALQGDEYENVLSLPATDERVTRYLKGETISSPGAKDGYILIEVDGYPLGWGKKTGNTIKNKYHSGWRLM